MITSDNMILITMVFALLSITPGILKKYSIEKKHIEMLKEVDENRPEDYLKRIEREFNECKEKNLIYLEIWQLNKLYKAKEAYIYELLEKKFDKKEMSYIRYDNCLLACRHSFDKNIKYADTYKIWDLGDEFLIKAKDITRGIEKLMLELDKYSHNEEDLNTIKDELYLLTNSVKEYKND